MRYGFLRLAQRAVTALILVTSSVVVAGVGCSSASSASEACCLAAFPGSTSTYCLCGSFNAPGINCTVATNGGACTLDCTQSGTPMNGTGATATSCEGQPIPCFNSMGEGSPDECTDSFAQCVDGHTYELTCMGTSCTCKEDDNVTNTGTGACGDESTLCGWNLGG